jgi:hypothetical protein
MRDPLEELVKPFLCRIVLAHTRGMGRPRLSIDIAPKEQKRSLGWMHESIRAALRAEKNIS